MTDESAWRCYLVLSVFLGLFGYSMARKRKNRSSITPVARGKWDLRERHYEDLIRSAFAELGIEARG